MKKLLSTFMLAGALAGTGSAYALNESPVGAIGIVEAFGSIHYSTNFRAEAPKPGTKDIIRKGLDTNKSLKKNEVRIVRFYQPIDGKKELDVNGTKVPFLTDNELKGKYQGIRLTKDVDGGYTMHVSVAPSSSKRHKKAQCKIKSLKGSFNVITFGKGMMGGLKCSVSNKGSVKGFEDWAATKGLSYLGK